jgi:hypothetical protein
MNEEQQAFTRAYQRNVAIASKDDVAEFFKLYMTEGEDFVPPIALYKWESICDAWGIWWEARNYKPEQTA